MTFTKERVAGIANGEKCYTHDDVAELARIALASLEAEAVCVIDQSNLDYLKSGSDADVWPAPRKEMGDVLLYRAAPPAPVSVPAAMEMDDDFDSAFEHGKAVGWNAYRAAMLQGAEQQNRQQNIPENIPATQFKPVADLYGLTSPTGSETSFTFDAVEARDFIDGGWSCQEYVELERFQEAITNHTEDKLAMVDHSGDSNNMVEPVTTAYKLPDDFDFDRFNDVVWLEAVASNPHMHSLTTSTIAMVALELNKRLEAGNSPVIPDGYCIMPLKLTADNGAKGALCGEFHVQYRIVCQSCVGEGCEDCNHTGGWDAEIPVSWDTIKRIHESAVEACALPAAPQQEA
ncbi:hypothetical protein [Huaxiibacter chinensis]|uniref:hypothetical protein n=1 Tax=Huaxiibacter chinensis TaxID=2899785 RepID=UPI003F97690F